MDGKPAGHEHKAVPRHGARHRPPAAYLGIGGVGAGQPPYGLAHW
jgi:hypothetical protein